MAQTAKTVEMMFEKVIETHEKQTQMLNLVSTFTPDAGKMQNAGDVMWRGVQQNRPLISGWDTTGEATDIIQEACPSVLETPWNDRIDQRADALRDTQFWVDAAEESGKKQSSNCNSIIANRIAQHGSIYYRSNSASGFNFISQARTVLNERQGVRGQRHFMLNDADAGTFSEDLAARQTLQGRPSDTWTTGQIGQNIAQFNIHEGSFLPNLAGGSDPATTVTGDQSFKPLPGTVVNNNVVTNNDYRTAEIVVADSSGYNLYDKVTITNGSTPVYALALQDKTNTLRAMTFTIVGKSDSTHMTIFPKPIAADDTSLTTLEAAHANIDTKILNTATVDRVNIDATNKTNLFWDEKAVEVMCGTIPASLFAQYEGMKVIEHTMDNGLSMYMLYGGDMDTLTFKFRLFTWFGVTVLNPSTCGVAATY